MKSLLLIAALVASLSAHATDDKRPPKQHGTTNSPLAIAAAGAVAASRSTAAALAAGGTGGSGGAATLTGSGNSTAIGGAAGAGGAGGAGGQGGAGGTVSGSGNGGGANVNVQASDRAATAFAAPVAGTNGTCMGGTSAGVQGAIGVSFATTWTDGGCDARYDAAALMQIGENTAARARLCLKPEIAQAFKAIGKPCPDLAEQKRAEAILIDGYVGGDPFVIARLQRQGKL